MVWRQEISHTEKVLISKLVCPLCGPIIMPWKHIEQNVGLLMYFVHLTVFVRFLKDFFHKYFFIGTVFIRFFSCELYQLIFFCHRDLSSLDCFHEGCYCKDFFT